ncbi:MAG: amidohydrolase [Candidatus Micrarchaeia archaeon]
MPSILIKNATIFSNSASGKPVKTDVLCSNGKIENVGKGILAKAEHKLDASGKILMPGLSNCHTHAAMSLLRGYCDDMILQDWLEKKIWPAEARMDGKAVRAGTELAALEMIKSGTTFFNDMYFQMDSVLEAAEKSGMRAVLGYGMIDMGDAAKAKKELAIAKAFAKKAKAAKNTLITASMAPHSPYTCSKELLQESHEFATKEGLPYHIHISETRKEVFDVLDKTGKRPVEYLDSIGVLGKNMVAAHCVWMTLREVELMGRKGAKAILNPGSNLKLASGGVPPLPEMMKAKVGVCLGTDGAASNNSLSMFEAAKYIALLVKNSRWNASIITAKEAFDFATAGGYGAFGLNGGKIEKGALADLILLDAKAPNLNPATKSTNMYAQVVYAGHAGNVTDSIIGGKPVMLDGKILTLDESAVVETANKEYERVMASLK